MIQKKRKVSIWLVLIGALLSGYVGYLLNGAWEPGITLNDFLTSFHHVRASPVADYYNETTIKAVVMALVAYTMAILIYITGQKNFMPGKEFGTARFADIQMVNKALADKDEGFNRILSQNVRMSLNTRLTKLNNNVLIIGGSGAGKTFYIVKPNLMGRP